MEIDSNRENGCISVVFNPVIRIELCEFSVFLWIHKWTSCTDSSTISLEDIEKIFLDRDNWFFVIQSNAKKIIRIIRRD